MAQIRQTKDAIQGASTSLSLTLDTSTVAGNCLLALIIGSTGIAVTISDAVNGNWPAVLQNLDVHGTQSLQLFAFQNSGAGVSTITAATGSGTVIALEVVEVMGVTASCVQGSNATEFDSVTIGVDTIDSGNITVTSTPSILVGFCVGTPSASGTNQFTYNYFWDLNGRNCEYAACLSYQRLTSGATADAVFSPITTDSMYVFGIVLTESTAPVDSGYLGSLVYSNSTHISSLRLGNVGPAGYCGIAVWTCDTTGNTVSPPSGWTQLFHGQINYDGADYYVWYNENLPGTGSSIWTVTCGAENLFVISVFSPIDQTTPIADSHENVVSTGVASPTSITALSVTTTRANSRVVWIGIADPDSGSGITYTPPSGYTSRIAVAGNQWTMIAISDQIVSSPSATGNEIGVFTRAGHNMGSNGVQIALNPVLVASVIPVYWFKY